MLPAAARPREARPPAPRYGTSDVARQQSYQPSGVLHHMVAGTGSVDSRALAEIIMSATAAITTVAAAAATTRMSTEARRHSSTGSRRRGVASAAMRGAWSAGFGDAWRPREAAAPVGRGATCDATGPGRLARSRAARSSHTARS